MVKEGVREECELIETRRRRERSDRRVINVKAVMHVSEKQMKGWPEISSESKERGEKRTISASIWSNPYCNPSQADISLNGLF